MRPNNKIFLNNRGSEILSTPIIIAIGIMLISTLVVICIKILTPYIFYEKLSSTCLKYVFVMEEYGYLTEKEKDNLKKELIRQGFNDNDLTIKYTNKRQVYGSPLYLKVNYKYNLELPIIGKKEIEMNINRESVSKR